MISTKQAAEYLGCSVRSVQRACAKHGVGQRVGAGIYLVLTLDDLPRLRSLINEGRGNPRIGEQSAKGVAARLKKQAKPTRSRSP